MGPTLLADAAPEIAPWIMQAGPYALLVVGIAWLARKWDAQNAAMIVLVREVVSAIAANTASLRELLQVVQESRRE